MFLLPAYAPELDPVDGALPVIRRSLANLAAGTLDRLAALVRTRLNRLQYRPDTLGGIVAENGLALSIEPP